MERMAHYVVCSDSDFDYLVHIFFPADLYTREDVYSEFDIVYDIDPYEAILGKIVSRELVAYDGKLYSSMSYFGEVRESDIPRIIAEEWDD